MDTESQKVVRTVVSVLPEDGIPLEILIEVWS